MIKLSDILNESLNPNIYQIQAKLVVNTKDRPMSDVLSDIRAIQGVTIVGVEAQDTKITSVRHVVTLNIKIDPSPFKPFSKETFKQILMGIKQIPAVLAAQFTSNPTTV
jgi:hypothetical protein